MDNSISSNTAISPKVSEHLLIADVRAIPFNLLQHDPDCDSLVSRIMDQRRGSSRVDVAMFNSAI